MAESAIDQQILDQLLQHGFAPAEFAALQRRLQHGGVEGFHPLEHDIAAPTSDDVVVLPEAQSADAARLRERGKAAWRQGQVAAVVLAGGMATRFCGAVKSAVEVQPGQSFLHLKLRSLWAAARQAEASLPIAVLTSRFTQEVVENELVALASERSELHTFGQSLILRLTPEGELFRDANGELSPHAPGHGDMVTALQRHGLLTRLQARGVRLLYVSNIDNLAAWLDPVIVGLHLERGVALSAEVVESRPDDAGGAWLRLQGKPQLVEGFRLAPALRGQAHGPLNTNNLLLDLEALAHAPPLNWFAVQKTLDGRPVVQFERILSELTAFLPSQAIQVPRQGDDCRFVPMKSPADLQAHAEQVRTLLARRGAA